MPCPPARPLPATPAVSPAYNIYTWDSSGHSIIYVQVTRAKGQWFLQNKNVLVSFMKRGGTERRNSGFGGEGGM